MAKQKPSSDDKDQQKFDELREDLARSYAFIEGQRYTQTASAMTPEQAMDQFIERVSGKDTPARPNTINRIKKNHSRLKAAILKIKNTPPEVFDRKDKKSVNNVNS